MERALQTEELDPFPFTLAKALGMTVETMLTGVPTPLSMREYLSWRAYYVWRNAQEELAMKEATGGR